MKLLILFLSLFSFSLFSQEEDEDLNKLMAEKQRQAEAYRKIDQGREALQSAPGKLIEDLKNAGHQTLDMKAILDPKMVDGLKNLYLLSGIQQMKPEEVRALIMNKVKGKMGEKIFLQFPKLLDLSVAVILDRHAIPQLMDLIKRQDDLKIFFFISIFLYILSFLLKKIFIPKEASFFNRLWKSIILKFGVLASSLGIFYFMFQKEVSPLVLVLKLFAGN